MVDTSAPSDCIPNSGDRLEERGKSRYGSVERRSPTNENGEFSHQGFTSCHQPGNFNTCNKYKSLVMITQGGYQPVSVVTNDKTTVIEPDERIESSQGLAGYYHVALEALTERREMASRDVH